MAIAATAAAPIASPTFQSANHVFNERTPWLSMNWSARGPHSPLRRPNLLRTEGTRSGPNIPHDAYSTETLRETQLRLRSMHRITQHSNTRHRHLHNVVRGQRTDSGRRARGDHVARIECHHSRNPPNQEFAGIRH